MKYKQWQRITDTMRLSTRGQMAIFIVLIFQVLFVFFAMIVNVGVVVHHKINLQNAADLGAYYAASKQAEVLNAISHYNYQIRQAYKLLSWRNRVLGAITQNAAGPNSRHPFDLFGELSSVGDVEVLINPRNGYGSPYVCTTWNKWSHVLEKDENFCAKLDENLKDPPEFPEPQFPAAPFLPFNILIYQQMQEQAESFAKSCDTYGIHNFQMSALWMRSYREVVRTRVEEIQRLARSLSERSFSDIDGGSVFEGAWNTIRHNLTRGNTVEFTESDLRIFNSLENSVTEQGGVRWLKKTFISPLPFYVDAREVGRLCMPDIKPCNIPSNYADSKMTPGEIQRLQIACQEPQEEHNPFRSTIGFEKNPWYMAYVGVEVQVKSIQPFMPFKGGITLTAKAYAKPFGGRIGPWLGKTWPKGADQSSSLGTQVDALLPVNSYSASTQLSDREAIAKAIPNYSRFPGDSLGLKSGKALASMGGAFFREVREELSIQDWMNVEGFSSNPAVRNFELASMAPDVFDITYYSIDPHFHHNYPNGQFKDFSAKGASTVSDQIQLSLRLRRSPPPYIVKDPAHLLTGWTPNQDGHHFNYDFPDGEFGVCPNLTHSRSSPEGLTRHGCPGKGGRAGYSVKLISSEYLNTPQILGGDGSVGQILNPPSN